MITETGSLVLKAGTIRSLATLMTLLFVLPCFAAEPSPTTQPRTCTFAGKVLQLGSDKPAANLALSGYAQGPNEQFDLLSLTTDEQGAFRTTVPAGSYVDLQWKESPDGSYLIDDEWYAQGNWQPISHRSVARDVTDLVLRVKLVPATQLQGHVVDSQGHPVQGVSVYANPRLLPAITDSTGSFTLKCVPQGRDVHLFALRDGGGFMGFLAKRMLGTVAQIKHPTTNPTLTLAPCRSFDGQVLTPDGLPAAQLSFALMAKLGHESLYQFQQSITTDAAGKFSTKRLIPNATYEISWNSRQGQNRDYDDGKATVDLSQLKPGESIKFTAPQYLNALMGQVVNDQGNPIKDAAIFLESRKLLPRDAWNNVPFHTDAQGQFVIPRLAPGNITLHISAPSYKGQQFTTATDSIDFKATLRPSTPTCQYRFVVVDENNQPLKGVPIRVCSTQPTQPMPTDNAGQARLELPTTSVAENTRVQAVCDADARDIAIAYLPPNEDAEIRLIAPKSQSPWRGRVLDELGKPIANAKIQIVSISREIDDVDGGVRPLPSNDLAAQFPHLFTQTDASGRFQFPRFSSYAFITFNLSAPGYVENTRDFVMSANPQKGQQDFFLLTAGSIKGRIVLKATGKPPTDKPEMNVELQGQTQGWANMDVNPDWTFSSDSMAPDTYTAHIQPRSPRWRKYVCATPPTVEVTARASADLLIELEEGIRIHGKLLDAKTDKPLSGRVLATLADTERSAPAYTDISPDGSWDLYLPRDAEYLIHYLPTGDFKYQQFKTIPVKRAQPPQELIIRAQRPQ